MNAVTPSAATLLADSTALSSPTPFSSDAELIAVCQAMSEAHLAYNAIYDGPNAVKGDRAAGKAAAPYVAQWDALVPELERLRATTAEGIAARAACLATHNLHRGFSFDYADTMTGRMLDCLLRDAAAFAARPPQAGPDAGLISACEEFIALEKTATAALLQADRCGERGDPAEAEHEAEHARLGDLQKPFFDAILATPCTTLAGVQAVARAWSAWDLELLTGQGDIGECLASKVAESVLAVPNDASLPPPSFGVDADLIARCAAYIQAIKDYNAGPDEACGDDSHPLSVAERAAKAALKGVRATTIAGVVAKAKVAMFEATEIDGSHNFDTSYTGDWPEQVVRDLLRLFGQEPA